MAGAQSDEGEKQAAAGKAKDDAAVTETSRAGYGNNAYTDAGTGAPSDEEAGDPDEGGE